MSLKIFNAFTLKCLMTIFMVLDHVAYFIPDSPYWFHWLGRIVAPIFVFLLTEGYIHTRDSKAYMKRLFIGAAIMFVGNSIIWLVFRRDTIISNSIFLSLALGVALLRNLEMENRSKLTIFFIILVSALAEGSLIVTAMVLIFYYFKEDKVKLSLSYILLSSLFLLEGLSYDYLFAENPQWMMVFALPFILMYNGERGPKIKYFFYIFYPVHIWVLYIIGYLMER